MIDTHCHIHDDDFELDADEVLASAMDQGVTGVVCVGTDAKFSQQAIDFAASRKKVWASVGLHPHDASLEDDLEQIAKLAPDSIAIGECGLDYYYDNSPRDIQQKVLRRQFEIAKECDLPMIFHIRGKEDDSSDAYADFWPIFDEFKPRGVVHSFSAHTKQVDEILHRDLFFGVNGIATFMKPGPQLDAIKHIPSDKLVVETDAPLLTPVPHRGRINEPKYILEIVTFLTQLRNEPPGEFANQLTQNAKKLFGI